MAHIYSNLPYYFDPLQFAYHCMSTAYTISLALILSLEHLDNTYVRPIFIGYSSASTL